MGEETKTPIKAIREWWGVVGVFLGIVGGYAWLDDRFDDLDVRFDVVDELKADRAELENQIKNQKQVFEARLSAKDCELQYTIAIAQTTRDSIADGDLIKDLVFLLPTRDNATPKAAEDREIHEQKIQRQRDIQTAKFKSITCLEDAKGQCEKNSKVDVKPCHYLNYLE